MIRTFLVPRWSSDFQFLLFLDLSVLLLRQCVYATWNDKLECNTRRCDHTGVLLGGCTV